MHAQRAPRARNAREPSIDRCGGRQGGWGGAAHLVTEAMLRCDVVHGSL
jgi:hypothetical protein